MRMGPLLQGDLIHGQADGILRLYDARLPCRDDITAPVDRSLAADEGMPAGHVDELGLARVAVIALEGDPGSDDEPLSVDGQHPGIECVAIPRWQEDDAHASAGTLIQGLLNPGGVTGGRRRNSVRWRELRPENHADARIHGAQFSTADRVTPPAS